MPRARTDVRPDDGLSTRERRLRPVLIVNTGDGNGKTTAAMGTELRAWNQGWSIGIFQFIKSGRWRVGERDAFAALSEAHDRTGIGGRVTWEVMGTGWSWSRAGENAEPAQRAHEGWCHVRELLAAQSHDLYLLDEFTYPLAWGWIDVTEVVETLAHRPGRQQVIITGRHAPDELVAAADIVTRMEKVKHPFDAGQRGQAGIEW